MYIYSDSKRASDPHALPDVEVFYEDGADPNDWLLPGWYWWICSPGCLPDGDPVGPFKTAQEAIKGFNRERFLRAIREADPPTTEGEAIAGAQSYAS